MIGICYSDLHMQGQFVKECVMTPLESLLALFQHPLHLMNKCRDKLLDYDHVQYALEHAEEPEKIKQLWEICFKTSKEKLKVKLSDVWTHHTRAHTHTHTHTRSPQ